MQISDEMKALEALARAYDHEEAACMGEPSPWVSADSEGDDEWKAERIVAARAGLDAYRSALSLPVQPVAWPGGFFKLGGDNRLRECASDGCHQHVSIRVERSGVGSDYCEPCARKIADLLTTPPVPPTKGPEDDLPEGWEGSADAMVWAKAYRYFVLKNNLTMSEAIDPGYMVGWFANYWAAITRDRLEPSAEDDLIAAREAAEDIEINYVVCDPKEVREQVAAAIMDALRKDRAIRSPPASALPVVEEDCHGLDTPERVCFYEQDFYVLSNFSSFSIRWERQTFPTSEHAYHWEKFANYAPTVAQAIAAAPSAHEAFKLAEHEKAWRRKDWDDVKVDIMRDILRAKANQHEYVRRKLLATGERELVENSWRDDFWGWGPNRDGKNMLGKLWMEVRAELRSALTPSVQP